MLTIATAVLSLAACNASAAQSVTALSPNGASGPWTAGGSCSSSACVDQRPGVGDDTYLTTAATSDSTTFDLEDAPALGGATVTHAKFVVRGQCANGTGSAAAQTLDLKVAGVSRATANLAFSSAGVQTATSAWVTITSGGISQAQLTSATLDYASTLCTGGGDTSRLVYDVEAFFLYGAVSTVNDYLRPVSGPGYASMDDPVGGADGSFYTTGTANSGATYGLSDASDPNERVVGINVAGKAACGANGGTAPQSVSLRNGGGGTVALTSWSMGTAGGGTIHRSATTSVNMLGSALSAYTIVVSSNACTNNPKYRKWFAVEAELDVLRMSVTGTALTTAGTGWSGCDGATTNMTLYIDGQPVETTQCTAGTGAFAFTRQPTAGQTYAVMMSTTGSARGMTIGTATSSSAISGVTVTSGAVRASVSSSITIADLQSYSANSGSESPIDAPGLGQTDTRIASPIFLQVDGGSTLTADRELRVDALRIQSSGTYNGGSVSTSLTGGGTGACSGTSPARSFCNLGTFNAQTGTISFKPSASTSVAVPGGTYHDIDIAPTYGGQSVAVQLGTSDVAATPITATSLGLDGSGVTAVDVSTTAIQPTITISGDVQVGTAATLSGSGSGTMTIGGSLTGNGTINMTGGTVDLRSAGTGTQLDASANPWQFATLVASTSSTARTVAIPGTSRAIAASALLRAGTGTDAAITTIDATAMTQAIAIAGTFDISTQGAFQAPPQMSVSGSFSNSGTFTPNTGTVTFDGPGTSTVTNAAPFWNVAATGSKQVALATSLNITGNLTLTGTSCASLATLKSSSGGVQRSLTVAAGNFSATNAAFQDIGSSTAITAVSAKDLGNNANIAFGSDPCDASAPTPNPMTATAVADSSTQITWTATTASDPSLHVLPYSVDSGTPAWQASRTFVESGLSANTQYTRTVRARDSAGNASTGTVVKYTLPNTPTLLTATAQDWNTTDTYSILLSWSAPSGGAASYNVRSSADGYASVVANTTSTSRLVSGLSANAAHTYEVCAVNADDDQEPTCTTPATATTAPAPPATSSSSSITSSSAVLDWPDVSGAAAYSVKSFSDAACTVSTGWSGATPALSTYTAVLLDPDRYYSYTVASIGSTGATGAPSPCFEFSSSTKRTSIAVSLDTNSVDFGNAYPGDTLTGSTTITTQTYGAPGYTISVSLDQQLTKGSDTIPATASGTIASPGPWAGDGFGFTIASATNLDPVWASGANYAAFATTPTQIHDTGAAFAPDTSHATDTTIDYRLTLPPTQAAGAYTATATYTVVPTG